MMITSGLALEELDFFSSELKILGVYHASEMRSKLRVIIIILNNTLPKNIY